MSSVEDFDGNFEGEELDDYKEIDSDLEDGFSIKEGDFDDDLDDEDNSEDDDDLLGKDDEEEF